MKLTSPGNKPQSKGRSNKNKKEKFSKLKIERLEMVNIKK